MNRRSQGSAGLVSGLTAANPTRKTVKSKAAAKKPAPMGKGKTHSGKGKSTEQAATKLQSLFRMRKAKLAAEAKKASLAAKAGVAKAGAAKKKKTTKSAPMESSLCKLDKKARALKYKDPEVKKARAASCSAGKMPRCVKQLAYCAKNPERPKK